MQDSKQLWGKFSKKGTLTTSLRIVLIGFTSSIIAISAWKSDLLERWEAKTWDWRVSLLADFNTVHQNICLILLDQDSLDWGLRENGITWPWPREIYGVIADFCRRTGVRSLAFDVLFTEPSKYGVEDDRAFADAVSRMGHAALSVFLSHQSGSDAAWPPQLKKPGFRINGLQEWLRLTENEKGMYPRAAMPVDELSQAGKVLCNVHLEPDPDGIYRRVSLFGVFDNIFLPSLGLGAFMAHHDDIGIFIGPDKLTVGNYSAPVDRSGKAILNYRGASGKYRRYSAAAVLKSEIRMRGGENPVISDVASFKDAYVFFGFSAPGLFDLRPAPVGGVYPGVEIQATMLDNFLSGDFIHRVPDGIMICLVIGSALLCAAVITVWKSTIAGFIVSAVFLAAPVGLSLTAYLHGFWMPLTVQMSAAVLTVGFALSVNYSVEGQQKRFIKNAFKQYLSPEVIEQIIQNPDILRLGGERKVISIFFSDLEGFTSISEMLEPEELTVILNEYLSAMTDIIHEEGGTVDKYEGDAIIAFWNAPVDVPDHPVRVVRAALRCQAKLAELRPYFRNRIGKDLLMRIGMNTGPAVVGNMGSHTRFDYTMLGDSVNLAARLEGVNKIFRTYTMISQSTRDGIGDAFAVRKIGQIAVVGRKEPVAVFEPMFWEEYYKKEPVISAFTEALNLFCNKQPEESLKIFSRLSPADPVSSVYENRCREINDKGDYECVWMMTKK